MLKTPQDPAQLWEPNSHSVSWLKRFLHAPLSLTVAGCLASLIFRKVLLVKTQIKYHYVWVDRCVQGSRGQKGVRTPGV